MRTRFAAFSYLSEANGSFIVKAHRVRRLNTGASATAEKPLHGAGRWSGGGTLALPLMPRRPPLLIQWNALNHDCVAFVEPAENGSLLENESGPPFRVSITEARHAL